MEKNNFPLVSLITLDGMGFPLSVDFLIQS